MLKMLYDTWYEFMKNGGKAHEDLSYERFLTELKNEVSLEKDIKDFHEKFNVPTQSTPGFVSKDLMKFRVNFIKEELNELEAAIENNDLVEVADALIDISYVSIGFANILGIPFQKIWDEVHKTNMAKVSGKEAMENGIKTIKPARHDTDVLKPLDWKAPDIKKILEQQGK